MRQQSSAGCLTGIVAFFSRVMLLMFWISRPVAWDATFGGFILPCLGFMFFPVTTMMYAWLMHGVGGIQGLDWLWLFLGLLMDVATIGTAGYANRDRLPPGVPGSMGPPQGPIGTPPTEGPPSTPQRDPGLSVEELKTRKAHDSRLPCVFQSQAAGVWEEGAFILTQTILIKRSQGNHS